MENKTINIMRNIYTDLDTIFDTRLGVLSIIDKQVALTMLDSEYYLARIYDEFDYINNSIFTPIYSNRNVRVLTKSFITKAFDLIIAELDLLVSKRVEANEQLRIQLDINTFPYILTETETTYIKNAISLYSKLETLEIVFIHLDTKQISLNYVSSSYDVIFMYNALNWLDYQISNSAGGASTTKLYGPALVKEPIKFNKAKELETLFDSQVELFGPYINYNPLPIEFFCYKENFRDKIKQDLL